MEALGHVAKLVLAMLRAEACVLRSRAPLACLTLTPLMGAVAPLTRAVVAKTIGGWSRALQLVLLVLFAASASLLLFPAFLELACGFCV